MRLRQPVTGEVARIAPPNIPEHCLRLSAKLLSLRSALPVRVASLFRQTRCAWQGGFCVYGIGAWIVHAGFFWVTVPFQPGEKRVTSVTLTPWCCSALFVCRPLVAEALSATAHDGPRRLEMLSGVFDGRVRVPGRSVAADRSLLTCHRIA